MIRDVGRQTAYWEMTQLLTSGNFAARLMLYQS
jgi:hypothetical protein